MRNLGKAMLPLLLCLWLGGCASIGPPLPPTLELPKAPVDLHALRKGDKITLTWTVPTRTTDRRMVRYLGDTEICRGLEPVLKDCGKPVGETPPPASFRAGEESQANKTTTSFVDKLLEANEEEHPSGFATYAVEVLNTAGRGEGLSNQVHVPLLPTVPPLAGFSAEVTAQGVLIAWKCSALGSRHIAAMKYLFRIYRRALSGGIEAKIAEIDVTGCVAGPAGLIQLSGQQANTESAAPESNKIVDSFLDKTFEWEKTYSYWGAVVSVMAVPGKAPVEVEGNDTPEVKVFADDVFPPSVPTGLQAASSGPGQPPFIDLIWTPDTDTDLAGYNVYRRQDGGPVRKLNSELVKVPAFRDTEVVAGNTYFYSVSAVDAHGNESARSEEASETVP
jgi:hypothetical protein